MTKIEELEAVLKVKDEIIRQLMVKIAVLEKMIAKKPPWRK